MNLLPGSRVGPYEIAGLIGAGGMGEVYRATDTNLGRDVAIKVLPAELAADAERLARFRREAQILAALSHPGIAAIHGLEVAAGTTFLVLELVEGEDLAQRLGRGPVPADEAIDIARRIAEALEEAHEKGIVHRDLKPANVKIAPDGRVKVLDFGLAKALSAAPASGGSSDLSRSPTLLQSATRAGVILGTAAYMAPEQARGRDVDRRADIWAFGAVLWEMLAGRPLFSGETLTDVLAAVLTREPEWPALPAGTPAHVVRLLRRCLERDPRRRLQAIGEARIALERGAGEAGGAAATGASAGAAAGGGASTEAGAAARPGRGALLTAAIAVLAAGVGVAATFLLRPPPPSPAAATAPVTFSIAPPEGHAFVGGLALSRDGRSLAFAARDPAGQLALWVRALDAVEPRRLAGTAGARSPFWAPDGRRIGFFAQSELKVLDLIGGATRSVARTVGAHDTRGATWGADDVIVYAPRFSGPLMRVQASGGTPEPATRLDAERKEGTHRWPSFLPDGRRFLFYASQGSGTEPGEVRMGAVGSDVTHVLTPAHSGAVFLPPATLLFVIGQSLVAQEVDLDRPGMTGVPAPLGVDLPGSIGISGFRNLSAAESGVVAWRQVVAGVTRLVEVDRQGRDLSTVADDGGWHFAPRLSPDGTRVAVTHYEAGSNNGDIHVHDAERHLDTRLTFDDLDEQNVCWSPDGRTIAVTVTSIGGRGIHRLDPARPGVRQPWRPSGVTIFSEDWFPDGSLLVTIQGDEDRPDLYRLPPGENAEPVPLVTGPFSEQEPSLTGDGRWLAYAGDSTGRNEIYVRSLATGEEWKLSEGGGMAPRWRSDGGELFFIDSKGYLVAVPTTPGPRFTWGTPVPLFVAGLDDSGGRQYDTTPDGRLFVLNRPKDAAERPVVVTTGLPARPRAE